MRARPYSTCVQVLRFAGFRLLDNGPIATCLRRGNRTVLVPRIAHLSEEMFQAMLSAAGMTEPMFEALLDIAPEDPPVSSRAPGDLRSTAE
jgi:hypothetical protein